MDDMSVSNAVNTALAMRDVNTVQEVQVALLKKVLASQADTMATLMQSLPTAVDSNLGSRINTHA
ncbi:putative motility protein [Pseudomonadota bacterium AL_CKDN230030165-1A_HGKHYDSX7]